MLIIIKLFLGAHPAIRFNLFLFITYVIPSRLFDERGISKKGFPLLSGLIILLTAT